MSSELPELRRIVTAHNDQGVAVIKSNSAVALEETQFPGIKAAALWVTADGLPTNENNNSKDGASEDPSLVTPNGTNFRYTDLGPGAITPMHRTASIDYNILIHGEIILILDDGSETLLKNPGDVVIQKGTMHAWRNPGDNWARWACVLIDGNPVVVQGKALETVQELPDGADIPQN